MKTSNIIPGAIYGNRKHPNAQYLGCCSTSPNGDKVISKFLVILSGGWGHGRKVKMANKGHAARNFRNAFFLVKRPECF